MVLEGRDFSASGAFSMFIGTKHVVVLSGQAGRKTFFQTKGLSLPQGFVELLTGKLSSAKDGDYGFSYFSRTFMELIRGYVLAERVPILNSDIRAFCDELILAPLTYDLSKWHSVNVASSVPLLIFKLMYRVVGATEIAESDLLLWKTFLTFLKFKRSTCNTRVVFPWLPTPLYILRLFSATMLYFVCTALAAGVATTSCTTLWLLTFLAHLPEWRGKCRDEVLRVVAAHQSQRPSPSSGAGSGPRTAERVLASLTLQGWESEFPIIGNCLRETLRLCLPGTVFRRNVSGADVPIGDSGEVIPQGAYVAYAISDVCEDPRLYPNTHVFDPSRWSTRSAVDRHAGDGEGAPTSDTYLGFGAGRYLCVLAYILYNYDFEPVNGGAAMPVPDRNIARLLVPEQLMHVRFKPLP
ncbi:cytochrome P450 [Diaporthe sp. PMI_573]|nr:cytochrome P450 [Diaporthaceae sp. PMI_573]